MKIIIRQETTRDHESVFNLIDKAFRTVEISDHQEPFLVERLRASEAFVPELSLVAQQEKKIVGHILLTKIRIVNDREIFESLTLAPVTVLPEFQNKGIGGQLIVEAHKRAKKMGFKSIILLGHSHYYPKFGYQLASKFGIKLPFEAPEENCMAVELVKNGLQGITGMVEYSKEFYTT